MEMTLLDDLYEEIITFAVVGGIGAMIAYFKKRKDKVDVIEKKVDALIKTQIISAKILDEQTERVHPELHAQLEEITKELLDIDN